MEQGAFGLVQVRSFVPPPEPRHDQVDEPPQEPATVHDAVPAEQAN